MRHVLTILAVDDLERACAFYGSVLAVAPTVRVPVYVEFTLPHGERLGVYERHGFARNTGRLPIAVPAGAISGTELYFHVADPAPVLDRLRAAGATELSPWATRPWGDEAAYYADPSGNVLVVARPALDADRPERFRAGP
jgi:catechol 2,3-dioxygenase-like lactoylglutathione lyase family enzyme